MVCFLRFYDRFTEALSGRSWPNLGITIGKRIE